MTEKKRVACFFTGGYTELWAMKAFFAKINPRLDYIRLCPIAERKSKANIKERDKRPIDNSVNGLTGKALINYVLCAVEKHYFQRENYDAVIIEDDKDSNYLNITKDGFGSVDQQGWEAYRQQVCTELRAKGVTVPIFYFLAAPEVETWFVADFDNSFGSAYQGILTTSQNNYFASNFRKYLYRRILTNTYADALEAYGYFNGKYQKLSEEIQNAMVQAESELEPFHPRNENGDPIPIHYSKRSEGENMLRHIQPEKVAEKCHMFFRDSYYELQSL